MTTERALMIFACPNCPGIATDGLLIHDGMCPQPEVQWYAVPLQQQDRGCEA